MTIVSKQVRSNPEVRKDFHIVMGSDDWIQYILVIPSSSVRNLNRVILPRLETPACYSKCVTQRTAMKCDDALKTGKTGDTDKLLHHY